MSSMVRSLPASHATAACGESQLEESITVLDYMALTLQVIVYSWRVS